MATVDMTNGTAGFTSGVPYSATPYLAERYVDFAVATTTKGSALANGDVFEVIDVPAGTVVLTAGFEVVTAMTGTSTDLTLDFGITGDDVDIFVDGFDYDGASVGDWGAKATGGYEPRLFATADTLDILIASQTGTFTGGKLRVWAVMMDVNGRSAPGVATAGS